jgi:translation initiation factor 2 subunit 2
MEELVLPEKKKRKPKPKPSLPSTLTYIDMLERAFSQLKKDENKLVLPPFTIEKAGTKKTRWNNFAQVCTTLNREPTHVQKFIESELGETTSLVGPSLLIRAPGKYDSRRLISLCSKYVKEYVLCTSCQTYQTRLEKDPVTRLSFVVCLICRSRRATTQIHPLFHATTRNDRKKDRLKD